MTSKDYAALLADFIKIARSATAQKPVIKVSLLGEAFDFPGLSAEVRDTSCKAQKPTSQLRVQRASKYPSPCTAKPLQSGPSRHELR
jgi:hypothetical protein